MFKNFIQDNTEQQNHENPWFWFSDKQLENAKKKLYWIYNKTDNKNQEDIDIQIEKIKIQQQKYKKQYKKLYNYIKKTPNIPTEKMYELKDKLNEIHEKYTKWRKNLLNLWYAEEEEYYWIESFREIHKWVKYLLWTKEKFRLLIRITIAILVIFLIGYFLDNFIWKILYIDSFKFFWYWVLMLWFIWLTGVSLSLAKWRMTNLSDFFWAITRDNIRKLAIWYLLTLWPIILTQMLWTVNLPISVVLSVWLCLLFSTKLIFFQFAIIDKWYNPIKAIKYSRDITKWYFRKTLQFYLVFIVWYNILRISLCILLRYLEIPIQLIMCIIIWLILIIPTVTLSFMRFYCTLSEKYELKNNNLDIPQI